MSASWTPHWGDKSEADVYANATFSVGGEAGSNSPVNVLGKLALGGDVLGAGGDLASASGSIANNAAKVDVEVAGSSVFSEIEHGTSNTKTYNETFLDENVPIPILGFDVILAATLVGTLILAYQLTDNGNVAVAALTPTLKLNGAFSVNFGEDLGVVSGSVGLYGSLMFANLSLPMSLKIGFSEDQSKTGAVVQGSVYACQLKYALSISATESHTLLAGNMGLQAKACIDYFIGSKCWSAQEELFNWSGITGNATLVDKSVATNVGPVYTDLPEFGRPLPSGQVFSADDSSGMPAACHNFGFGPPGAVNEAT